MGMDAYALKFKKFVKFGDVSQLFDQYGNYPTWQDTSFKRLDYTNPRMKEWLQTIPGFDEKIHTHQFEPNVDAVETLKANGIEPDSDFEVIMFSDDILIMSINESGSSRVLEITSDKFKYEPMGKWYAFVEFSEEGYVRKPFYNHYSMCNATNTPSKLATIIKSIDAKQADEADMYFVSQTEISQITPYVNQYDLKNWKQNFDQPNIIVYLNW